MQVGCRRAVGKMLSAPHETSTSSHVSTSPCQFHARVAIGGNFGCECMHKSSKRQTRCSKRESRWGMGDNNRGRVTGSGYKGRRRVRCPVPFIKIAYLPRGPLRGLHVLTIVSATCFSMALVFLVLYTRLCGTGSARSPGVLSS